MIHVSHHDTMQERTHLQYPKVRDFTVSDMHMSVISDDGVSDPVVAVQAYLQFRGFWRF